MTDLPNTPRVSTDNIHIHPDYKIYRRSASKSSLKTVLSSVSSKLRSGSEHFWGSLFSLSHDDHQTGTPTSSFSSGQHSKVVHFLASRYEIIFGDRTVVVDVERSIAILRLEAARPARIVRKRRRIFRARPCNDRGRNYWPHLLCP